MSLLYHTYQKADLQDRDYGFILALVSQMANGRRRERALRKSADMLPPSSFS